MHARGRQAENRIAGADGRRQQVAALGGPDREAGEVVVAFGVHARHLRRLAADQGAAGEAAALGDARDHALRRRHVQRAGGEIIQEEQRCGALHHEVVDAHRHQIDADMVMNAGVDGDLELGADAIGGGNQNRVREPRRLEIEQRAKAAETAHHPGARGRFRQRFDRLDKGVARLDIHAGIPVSHAGHVSLRCAKPMS